MIKSKSKSAEYFNTLQEVMLNHGALSEFEYKKVLKDLDNDKSSAAVSALGFAHAIYGDSEKAISWFKSFEPFNDIFVFKAYGALLKYLCKSKELIRMSLNYSEVFKDQWFAWMCAEDYYMIGDIANSARKAREFLSMLPEGKNKERAEYSLSQQLDSLFLVYSSGHCTQEQFKIISDLTLDILENHDIPLHYIEVFFWGEDGTNYEVGVPLEKGDHMTLATLNDELIKKVIKTKELDGCEVMPCFTHGGISHWRYIHGA